MEQPTMLRTFARSLSTSVSTHKNPSQPYQSEKDFRTEQLAIFTYLFDQVTDDSIVKVFYGRPLNPLSKKFNVL